MTITFIEAKPFTLRIKSLGADEELEALKKELVESPEKRRSNSRNRRFEEGKNAFARSRQEWGS